MTGLKLLMARYLPVLDILAVLNLTQGEYLLKYEALRNMKQSPVAQLAEQMAVNHLVRGSSPCWGAKFYRPNQF